MVRSEPYAIGPDDGGAQAALLAGADPVWRRVPEDWTQAPFLGDGLLGVQLHRGADDRSLAWTLNHSEIQDHRPQWEAGIGLSRLPVGSLAWRFNGEITAVDWRLDLHRAELRGSVTTTRGSATLRAAVLSGEAALLVETTAGGGEDDTGWSFDPLPAVTDRTKNRPDDYTPNPEPHRTVRDGAEVTVQPLRAGGDHATAWRRIPAGDPADRRHLLVAALRHAHPGGGSGDAAAGAVHRLLTADPADPTRRHRRWWADYYAKSHLSVPDKRLQSFYWIQLYKLASATRRHAPVIAEWGPWYPAGDPWTAVWWNLNAQVSYWPIHGSNHEELDALTQTFRDHAGNLPQSLPEELRHRTDLAVLAHPTDRALRPGAKTAGLPGTATVTDNYGNLTWALHNVWLSYRHTLDESILRDVLRPLLTKAVDFYAEFLAEGADGRLHLAATRSPEYADAEDAAYDLALLRWGCATLLETARILGPGDGEGADRAHAARLRDILDRLTPYHRRPGEGVLIGRDVPLADSHRHFSHLLWLYPLAELTWDRPADRELMLESFRHWESRQDAWHGYSLAAACSMLAVMNAPDEALAHLRRFVVDREVIGNTVLTENTMYREGRNGALESPLCAAQALLDLCGQSWGGVLRPLAAVPSSWADASVAGMRMQGAFLVDAARSAGRTDWVRVRSERGARCVLRPGIEGRLTVSSPTRRVSWRRVGTDPAFGGDLIRISLRAGEEVLVHPAGAPPRDTRPRDVPGEPAARWGLPG